MNLMARHSNALKSFTKVSRSLFAKFYVVKFVNSLDGNFKGRSNREVSSLNVNAAASIIAKDAKVNISRCKNVMKLKIYGSR